MNEFGIKQRHVTPYFPQTIREVELLHKTLKKTFKAVTAEGKIGR